MGWLFHACFTEVCEQLRSGAAARPLSRVLNPLVAKLVAFSKVGEGDLVHMLGGTLVFAFVAPQAVGGGGGKEDELRGEGDSQCLAACRCGLHVDREVAQTQTVEAFCAGIDCA
jgi:hypothetical protein